MVSGKYMIRYNGRRYVPKKLGTIFCENILNNNIIFM